MFLTFSWWTFRIFLIVCSSGERQREEASEQVVGGRFLLDVDRGGGLQGSREGGSAGRGGLEGGGLNFFFSGPNSHQVFVF